MKKIKINNKSESTIELRISGLGNSFTQSQRDNCPWSLYKDENIFYPYMISYHRNKEQMKLAFILNIQAWQEARRNYA